VCGDKLDNNCDGTVDGAMAKCADATRKCVNQKCVQCAAATDCAAQACQTASCTSDACAYRDEGPTTSRSQYDGQLVAADDPNLPAVYYVWAGTKFQVARDTDVDTWYGGWVNVRKVPASAVNGLMSTPSDKTMFRTADSAIVYRMQGGTKRHITSDAAVNGPCGGFASVGIVPPGSISGIPDGAALP
jgi:hypothetical protein